MITSPTALLELTKLFKKLSKGIGGKECSKMLSTGVGPAKIAR